VASCLGGGRRSQHRRRLISSKTPSALSTAEEGERAQHWVGVEQARLSTLIGYCEVATVKFRNNMAFLWFSFEARPEGLAPFLAVTTFAGICMGAVGVGGVVIVPSMIVFLGVDPRLAVASTIPGYVWASSAGMWAYSKDLRKDVRRVLCIMGGALAGGFGAAFGLRSIPADALKVGIALFCMMFGAKALWTSSATCAHVRSSAAGAEKANLEEAEIELAK